MASSSRDDRIRMRMATGNAAPDEASASPGGPVRSARSRARLAKRAFPLIPSNRQGIRRESPLSSHLLRIRGRRRGKPRRFRGGDSVLAPLLAAVVGGVLATAVRTEVGRRADERPRTLDDLDDLSVELDRGDRLGAEFGDAGVAR